MDVIEVSELVTQRLQKITPSNVNSILKCPLRGLYMNRSNYAYLKKASSPFSMLGSLLHKINEDFSNNKINSDADFTSRWSKYEKTYLPDGFKERVKNFGVLKALSKSAISHLLNHKNSNVGRNSRYKALPEEPLKDEVNGIEGKIDLLILKDDRPIEIKDYKTGSIYDSDANSDLDNDAGKSAGQVIKEDYRKQLLLYAWLVKQKYNQYPEKLTVVDSKGTQHSISFTAADITDLINELNKLKYLLAVGTEEILANASDLNCKYCSFRFRCRFSFKPSSEPIVDLNGYVTAVKSYPYGNLSLELNGNLKIVFHDKDESLIGGDLLNHHIILSFARQYYYEKEIPTGLLNFYIPTRHSQIIKLI